VKTEKLNQKGNVLILVLIIVIVAIGGVCAYFKYYKLAYSDPKYGFMIKDQREWYSVPKKENVYYSLGTSDSPNGEVVSYFGVSPVTHTSKDAPTDLETYKQECAINAKETNTSLLEASNVTLNNLQGYLCIAEGKATNVDKIYILKQYFLLNNKGKYDYILAISYPKGDLIEEEKVTRIINSFYAK
jgi:hypothetical protein